MFAYKPSTSPARQNRRQSLHQIPPCRLPQPLLLCLAIVADASTHKCRVVDTPLTPEGTTVDYNSHNVEFTPANATQPAQMRVQMQGNSGARVQPKAPRQLYGQFEATAKVSSAVGAVTAFYVSAAQVTSLHIQHSSLPVTNVTCNSN